MTGTHKLVGLILVAALAAALVASCGGGGGGGQNPTIKGTEYKFDPAEITIQANQQAKVTLQNEGGLQHSWTVEGMEQQINTGAVPSKQSKSVTFTIDKAGTYNTYCDIPGHKESGMVGKLNVR